MGLDQESMVGVERQLQSPTSKIASHTQMYVTEHYHEVDEHA